MSTLKGRVLTTEVKQGQSKNGEWKRLQVVIETSSQYNNTVPVSFFNPEFNTPSNGSEVEIEYYIGGREYQGKYYAQVDGKTLTITSSEDHQQSHAPTSQPEPLGVMEDEDSNLPF